MKLFISPEDIQRRPGIPLSLKHLKGLTLTFCDEYRFNDPVPAYALFHGEAVLIARKIDSDDRYHIHLTTDCSFPLPGNIPPVHIGFFLSDGLCRLNAAKSVLHELQKKDSFFSDQFGALLLNDLQDSYWISPRL